MDNVVDFVCLRIQGELEKFMKNNTLPSSLLDGAFSIDDIERCWDNFSGKQKLAAEKLQNLYAYQIRENRQSFLEAFQKDYHAVLAQLDTEKSDFQFPGILSHYRPSINPVTALYYETRYAMRNYDPTSPYHSWIWELVTDKDFNNRLQDALSHDIGVLECILNRYYVPMQRNNIDMPLELMHARELSKRFKYYLRFFRKAINWDPES